MLRKIYEECIYKPNKWYDRLQEPRRFMYFFLMMLFCAIPTIIFSDSSIMMFGIAMFGFWRIIYFLIEDNRKIARHG